MNTGNNISFDDNNFKFKSRTIFSQSEIPGMTRFLVNKGLVKNEKQAIVLMFIIAVIFFISGIFIIYINFFKKVEYVQPLVSEDGQLLESILNNQTE